ncbi:MAG: aspartate dehydrogenase [Burkholderiaceae bacterium]
MTNTRPPRLRIALVGCGAIGRAVLELIRGDAAIETAAIVVRPAGVTDAAAFARGIDCTARIESAVPDEGIDLVVETAGHTAVAAHVVPALERGIDCVLASVGALAEDGLAASVETAARKGGARLHLVSGALGAIDALSAASVGGLESVSYTGRKPPRAWKGTPAEAEFELDRLTVETVIFEGSAREATLKFPKNANVAAIASLAGIGFDATRVRLIADPAAPGNLHQLEARGAFGEFEFSIRNAALPSNPKSSALAAYSIARKLQQLSRPIVV